MLLEIKSKNKNVWARSVPKMCQNVWPLHIHVCCLYMFVACARTCVLLVRMMCLLIINAMKSNANPLFFIWNNKWECNIGETRQLGSLTEEKQTLISCNCTSWVRERERDQSFTHHILLYILLAVVIFESSSSYWFSWTLKLKKSWKNERKQIFFFPSGFSSYNHQ